MGLNLFLCVDDLRLIYFPFVTFQMVPPNVAGG